MRDLDVQRFLDRDWARLAQAKSSFWSSKSPSERLASTEALRQQVLATHPDWPSAEDRAADLEAHEALSRLMKRVQLGAD